MELKKLNQDSNLYTSNVKEAIVGMIIIAAKRHKSEGSDSENNSIEL